MWCITFIYLHTNVIHQVCRRAQERDSSNVCIMMTTVGCITRRMQIVFMYSDVRETRQLTQMMDWHTTPAFPIRTPRARRPDAQPTICGRSVLTIRAPRARRLAALPTIYGRSALTIRTPRARPHHLGHSRDMSRHHYAHQPQPV